jgi:hypothetical protein
MQVSCKVSYSVLVYFERQGAQLDPFFETHETPIEILKDTSCWLEASKMEEFLLQLLQFLGYKENLQIFREIGQNNFELRAWGVLDSVLKMVESPKEIFTQPDRFISYFLTPPPEFAVVKQDENKITLKLEKIATAQAILHYLMGAVEGLPKYMGNPAAQIELLDQKTFQLTWYDDQQSLFDEQEKKHRQFHPQIVHSVIQSLKDQKQELISENSLTDTPEHMANLAFEKMVSVEVEKRMQQWLNQQKEMGEIFFKVKNDFYKMYDYFIRAQQIITLIGPTARKASVREAMRRVDWDYVQKEFPNLVEQTCDSILSLKEIMHMPTSQVVKPEQEAKEPVDLNQLIDNLVEKLSLGEKAIKIDKRLQVDKNILVEPLSFAQAMNDVLKSSIQKSAKECEIKIVTRPVGSKIQIEVSDNSLGFKDETLENIFKPNQDYNLRNSQEIIERHNGNITISSRHGEGSTYLIELPI